MYGAAEDRGSLVIDHVQDIGTAFSGFFASNLHGLRVGETPG